MLRVNVKVSGLPPGVRNVSDALADPSGLNQALGERLEDELYDYFTERNFQPNKRSWRKQGWWGDVAAGTVMTGADSQGAEVTVDAIGFALRVYGGTVRPKNAKALTIPLIESAYGRRASEFPGELFIPRGTNVLAREDSSERGFEAVYWLAKSVEREPDPEALPPIEQLEKALADEAREYVKREFNN